MTLLLYFLAYLINEFDKSKITNVTCPLCHRPNSVLLYPQRKKKKQGDDRGDFACSSFDHGEYPDVYYCMNCQNGFLKPIGTDEREDFVNKGFELYKDVEDTEYIKNLPARYITNKKLVSHLSDYFEKKDVLEIGAYYGAFHSQVKDVANSYVGIEPSSHACEYLKKKNPDIEIYNGYSSDLEKFLGGKDKLFDTIVLWDVIEHVPDPIQTLRECNQFLKEGGKIIFSTINIESSFSIALGPWWPWFMDMHYYYFSDRGYVDILNRSGYVIRSHEHFPYYVYLGYFFKKVFSILFGKVILEDFFEKNLKTPIRIRFGDTVMIIGEKVS